MITRLLRNQEAVKATLAQQKHKYVTELLGGEAYVSCSVVLPALCHLYRIMEISDEDPTYMVRFKTAFKKDLAEWQADTNNGWLKLASALDPRFKDLKCLPRGERDEVCTSLEDMLQEAEPRRATPQPSTEDEPAKKKRSLLLLGSDSESDKEMVPNRALYHYKAEPSISMDECPLQWWSCKGVFPGSQISGHPCKLCAM
ncbi:hypothetical protein SKAU_G00168670 [Synaphobranchus kaupii]|uniref:Uncharacterized protein n=1 Tax=Synaphobranchus kaupii TaxID=118154 RepID=A0A9Q1FKG6_SYNKA|nr:hypothetical protein SKAU_G00168670 [Synaphobranchus kaupii]